MHLIDTQKSAFLLLMANSLMTWKTPQGMTNGIFYDVCQGETTFWYDHTHGRKVLKNCMATEYEGFLN